MICLIGGKGGIGSRYSAIMKYLQIPYVIADMDTPEINIVDYDKFIVATPTETHVHFLKELEGRTILCEKPVSKNPTEIPMMKHAFVVNNWEYVVRLMNIDEPLMIEYDYYRSGKDGLYWDCCQLLYLDPQAKLSQQSPKWNVKINGKFVPYRTLEESYIRMIKDFSQDRFNYLWTLEQGKEMSEVVCERMARKS